MPSREIENSIARGSAASPSERANAQLFVVELYDLLGVLRPEHMPGSGYAFELPVAQACHRGAEGNSSLSGAVRIVKHECRS